MDKAGRLPLQQLQALACGSRVSIVVGKEGGMEGCHWRLRAQRPVPGVREDDDVGGGCTLAVRGGRAGVFGQALDEVPARRRGSGAMEIVDIPDEPARPPWIVEELCSLLEARGAGSTELFRRVGDPRRVAQVRSEVLVVPFSRSSPPRSSRCSFALLPLAAE